MHSVKRLRGRGYAGGWITITFCDVYDQCSFDPSYPTMALEEFRPLVDDLMSRPRGDASEAVVSWAVAAEPTASGVPLNPG